MSGHSDVAIGSRLAHGSRVVRGAKREFISRCYNIVLRGALGARFSDAQCGFKAIRADVAAELLPLVEDPTWFFDTELLVLAERSGLRILEVPVDWYDDPDSRVDIVSTALDDLRGVRRLRRSIRRGALPLEGIAARIGRRTPGNTLFGQLVRFAAVGVVSTVTHLGLFAAFRAGLESAQTANLAALLLATLANTAMNRRWTFAVRGSARVGRHHLQSLCILAVTWLMTATALGVLHLVNATPDTWLETATIGGATAASTLIRFVAMRAWIFRRPVGSVLGAGEDATGVPEDDDAGPVPPVDLAVADRHLTLADR